MNEGSCLLTAEGARLIGDFHFVSGVLRGLGYESRLTESFLVASSIRAQAVAGGALVATTQEGQEEWKGEVSLEKAQADGGSACDGDDEQGGSAHTSSQAQGGPSILPDPSAGEQLMGRSTLCKAGFLSESSQRSAEIGVAIPIEEGHGKGRAAAEGLFGGFDHSHGESPAAGPPHPPGSHRWASDIQGTAGDMKMELFNPLASIFEPGSAWGGAPEVAGDDEGHVESPPDEEIYPCSLPRPPEQGEAATLEDGAKLVRVDIGDAAAGDEDAGDELGDDATEPELAIHYHMKEQNQEKLKASLKAMVLERCSNEELADHCVQQLASSDPRVGLDILQKLLEGSDAA